MVLSSEAEWFEEDFDIILFYTLLVFVATRAALSVPCLVKRSCEIQYKLCSHTISNYSPKFSNKGLIMNLKDSLRWFDFSKSVLRAGGVKLYENIADKIHYEDFFEALGLPDTLFSWFLVLELHVWMVMARLMAEKDGRFVRNVVVETMWEDVRVRMKKLEDNATSNISKNLEELSNQFAAAIIGYDEGLLADDRCLAGALWRRILQQKYGSAASLEMLVKYVREQMHELDKLNREEILRKPDLKWNQISIIKAA